MRRLALSIGLLVLATAAATGTPASAPGALPPDVVFLPGRFVPGAQPDGNTLVWRGVDGLVVLDTGRHPAHAQAILDVAQAQRQDIAAIINSHWHLDHVGGDIALRERFPQARLYAGNGIEAALGGFLAGYRRDLQGALQDANFSDAQKAGFRAELDLLDHADAFRPTDPVTAERTLPIAGRALTLHLAPHAASATDVWVEDAGAGVVASGDLVTLPVPFLDTACADGWQRGLDAIAATPFRTLVPGHGAPMTRAQFDDYRIAFANLRQCALAGASHDRCLQGWIGDTRRLEPATDTPQARGMLAYYLDGPLAPARQRGLCAP